jgi:sphinganine C4-monooxygenase
VQLRNFAIILPFLSDITNTMFAPDDGILPPLPTYKLTPLPPLVSPIPDKVLTLLLPVAAYWGLSMFFHWLDTNDYLPQYRLHTPAEVLKRNRVSRWEVIRDVLIQQAVQTGMGIVLILTEPEDTYGKEDFDIAVWTRRVRAAQKAIPWLLSIVGVNSKEIASHMATSHPLLARALSGGYYPSSKVAALVSDDNSTTNAPGYVSWEVLIATAIYYYIVPMIQFGVGLFIVDTWDYFLHRILHMNQWLYSKFFTGP